MSFLDIMSCGFGAIVLILLISQFQTNDIIVDENQAPSIQKLEEDIVNSLEKKIKLTSLMEDLEKRIPSSKDKLVLVPNTIRKSFYSLYKIDETIMRRYKNNFVILYLGDTHLRRGLKTAINATEKLKSKIRNLKLVIVGKNTTDSILKKYVQDLKLDDFVDFEGWQNVSLFQSYILASHVCISPLHRNLQHDVAYANKIFQYMSFGKPLLVSDAIAQKKIVEKNNTGLVHKEKDVEDFSSKVITLYKDEELRSELGKNGMDFVRNEFSWEKTSKKLIELYDNLTV